GVRRSELDGLLADLAGHGVPVTTLDVLPISDHEVGALARSLHDLDAARVEQVVSAAEGNPLLAVEATRALVTGSTGPPANLRAAVTATVSRLPEPTTCLVEVLAAAGRPLWPEELRRLEAPTGSDVVASSEGLLVRREGRIGFRHELLRAAVYAGLADAAGLHDRLADGIDPSEHVERAHHLTEAGRPREAARELGSAALGARTVGALDESVDLLERAVALAPEDGRLWLELEETCAYAHRQHEMEAAWQQALRYLPEEALPAAYCRRGRQFRTVTCHPEESLLAYRTAERLATADTPPEVLADAMAGMAWGNAVAGSGDDFERLLADALRLVDAGPQLRADALEIRMQGLIRQGRFAEAAALVADPRDPVVRLVDQYPDRRYSVLVNAAAALMCADDDLGALALVDRALSTHAVTGLELKTLAARAQVLARLGRHEEAAEAADQVQQWADRLDDPTMGATSSHDRGLVALSAGRYVEAADLLGRALAGGARVSRVTAGLTRAEALALAGDADGATAQLRTALLEPVGRTDQAWALVPRVAWVQALVAHARGDLALTQRRLEEAAAAWQRLAVTARDDAGEEYLASLVDLGRPPVVGLVEPGRELGRITALAATLEPLPESVATTTVR
ncbi:MAG: transcriptional activator domain-containing protein, partial [Nocardioides sp.]